MITLFLASKTSIVMRTLVLRFYLSFMRVLLFGRMLREVWCTLSPHDGWISFAIALIICWAR